MCPPEVGVFCCRFHKIISDEEIIDRHKVISNACQESGFGFVLVCVEVGRTTIYNPACTGCLQHSSVLLLIVLLITHASSVLAINSAECGGAKHPVIHELR